MPRESANNPRPTSQTLWALVSVLKVHQSKKKRKALNKYGLSGRDARRKTLLPKKNMVWVGKAASEQTTSFS